MTNQNSGGVAIVGLWNAAGDPCANEEWLPLAQGLVATFGLEDSNLCLVAGYGDFYLTTGFAYAIGLVVVCFNFDHEGGARLNGNCFAIRQGEGLRVNFPSCFYRLFLFVCGSAQSRVYTHGERYLSAISRNPSGGHRGKAMVVGCLDLNVQFVLDAYLDCFFVRTLQLNCRQGVGHHLQVVWRRNGHIALSSG